MVGNQAPKSIYDEDGDDDEEEDTAGPRAAFGRPQQHAELVAGTSRRHYRRTFFVLLLTPVIPGRCRGARAAKETIDGSRPAKEYAADTTTTQGEAKERYGWLRCLCLSLQGSTPAAAGRGRPGANRRWEGGWWGRVSSLNLMLIQSITDEHGHCNRSMYLAHQDQKESSLGAGTLRRTCRCRQRQPARSLDVARAVPILVQPKATRSPLWSIGILYTYSKKISP